METLNIIEQTVLLHSKLSREERDRQDGVVRLDQGKLIYGKYKGSLAQRFLGRIVSLFVPNSKWKESFLIKINNQINAVTDRQQADFTDAFMKAISQRSVKPHHPNLNLSLRSAIATIDKSNVTPFYNIRNEIVHGSIRGNSLTLTIIQGMVNMTLPELKNKNEQSARVVTQLIEDIKREISFAESHQYSVDREVLEECLDYLRQYSDPSISA